MEIMPGIIALQSTFNNRKYTQYVLCGAKRMLIDTGIHGWVSERIEPQLNAVGLSVRDMDYVVNTHADIDHYGGNHEIRFMGGKPLLMAHKLDAPWIESWTRILAERYSFYDQFSMAYNKETKDWLRKSAGPDTKLDIYLSGGESFYLDPDRQIEIIHLPGHSPGMIGIWDKKNKALIASDSVLWKGMIDEQGKLEGPPPYFELISYRKSLNEMLQMPFERLLLSHYPMMERQEGLRFLAESLEHTFEVERFIAEFIKRHGIEVHMQVICEHVNNQFGPYSVMPNEMAGSISAHLAVLLPVQ